MRNLRQKRKLLNMSRMETGNQVKLQRTIGYGGCAKKKPSGKCHVPDEIHLQWVKGGVERQKLRDQLEQCNWEKEWANINETSHGIPP